MRHCYTIWQKWFSWTFFLSTWGTFRQPCIRGLRILRLISFLQFKFCRILVFRSVRFLNSSIQFSILFGWQPITSPAAKSCLFYERECGSAWIWLTARTWYSGTFQYYFCQLESSFFRILTSFEFLNALKYFLVKTGDDFTHQGTFSFRKPFTSSTSRRRNF